MTAIDDIEKLLRSMKDRGAEMKAFEGLLTEIGSSLADIVALMEKPESEREEKPLDLGPLVSAIKGLKLEVTVSPPAVQVNVPKQDPPTVNVHPTLQASDWSALKITVDRGRTGNGPMEAFTVTKIK